MLDTMQSLWIGDRLSTMERMSINSFLKNGHPFHLYVYGMVENLPNGVELKDANEIIPQGRIFTVRGGYSSFSDFFRWKLIRDRGGWWVDTDTICLKPWVFEGPWVFVGGKGPVGSDDCVSSGMFKIASSESSGIARWAWEQCLKMDPTTMPWGQAGPPLITDAVHGFGLQEMIRPGKLFFPIFYTDAPQIFVTPNLQLDAPEAYSLHWFNEMWRLAGQDKDATYPASSIYETMKRKYL